MPGRLEAKTCLITGATGMAAAAALLAAREGARVFVAGLHEEDCRSLAGSIHSARGACEYHAGDLTLNETAETAAARCVEIFGRIDALFNVAGISGRRFGDGPLHECTEAGWDATLAVNLRSMFLVSRAVLCRMLRQPPAASGLRGAILNMSSASADSPQARFFATHAYAASKGAVNSLTRAMAAYYAPHKIRVNAIAPGLVRTPMSLRAQSDPEILEFMKTKQALLEDLIEPAEVARAAVFLLSDDARAVTGEIFSIDAGWAVRG
ncbi:MAG: SDR family oxidoreductase [Bryobacterales bacterium]|nr:SDR family oxidoreductase [Bryobacterales bacterium]